MTLPFSDLPREFLGVPIEWTRPVGRDAPLGRYATRFRLGSFGCELEVDVASDPVHALFSCFKRPNDPLFQTRVKGPVEALEAHVRGSFIDLARRTAEVALLVALAAPEAPDAPHAPTPEPSPN